MQPQSALIPAAALAAARFGRPSPLAGAALLAGFLALSCTSESLLGNGALYRDLNAYGVLLWGGLALFGACAWLLASDKTVP